MAHSLFGVPLGARLTTAVGAGALGLHAVVVLAGLLCVLTAAAAFSRWVLARTAPAADGRPAAADTGIMGRMLSFAPFAVVVFAAIVPLAAVLYLITSTMWTAVERAVLRRRVTPGSGGGGFLC